MPVHAGRFGACRVPTHAGRYRDAKTGRGGREHDEQGRSEREARRRRLIVEAVRAGESQRRVAERLKVGRGTVQRALALAGDADLDEVVWTGRSTAPHRTRRTAADVEQRVLAVRGELRAGIVGDHGPIAIREAMLAGGAPDVPSTRTIARIVARLGDRDRVPRVRRPAPPKGWYLPPVAAGRVELDSLDAIVDLPVLGRGHLDVLTAVSLHGGDPDAWPGRSVTALGTVAALEERWRRSGLPGFAQFDNDSRFLGAHASPDILGRVPIWVLQHGVVPVFAPVREMGFQGAIEGFNAYWQQRVYRRSFGWTPEEAAELSRRFIEGVRVRRATRIAAAPSRRPWSDDIPTPDGRGRIIFLRRVRLSGEIEVLGRLYPVDRAWGDRLVRAELDLDDLVIRSYGLFRRDPTSQPLLSTVPYVLPARRQWVARLF